MTFRLFRATLWCGFVLLAGCGTSGRYVPVRVAGGQTVQLSRQGQSFREAENSLAAVTNAGLTAVNQDGNPYLRWTFVVRLKRPTQLRSVRVEDISGSTPALLINDQAPATQTNQWTGFSGLIEGSAASTPWLFDNYDTTRVFRLTITESSGQSYVLYQGAFFSANKKAEMRHQYRLG